MTHTDLRGFYQERGSRFAASSKAIIKKINVISNLRLCTALIFAATAYFGFPNQALLYALPALLVVFVVLVRKHGSLFDRKVHLASLERIQLGELSALDGDFSHNSSGSEFVNVHHPYTHDLDIFGEGSLFQCINRSSSSGGKRLLAGYLSQGKDLTMETGKIEQRQEAVRELSFKTEFRHEIQALGMQVDEGPDDQRQLDQWLSQPPFVFGRASYRFMLRFFPALTLVLVVAAFIIEGLAPFAFLAAGLQWVMLGFQMRRINAFHDYVSRKKNTLEKYGRMLFFIRKETYSSAVMESLRTRAGEADEKVRKLASLVSFFDARLNLLANLVGNSLLLYDLQCVYRIERWKEKNGELLNSWIDVVRETEVLCSLGTFSFNHPKFVFPELNNNQTLSGRGLGHPLLDEKERVVNDIDLDMSASIMIITGANMAGKSTFLRSVGVNVVLGLSGAPVCAEKFDCPLIQVRSGMRTADSLKENQSYFYAELDRLKSIMDELRGGTPLLILLDEILKGTNSKDKHEGSLALVKQLTAHPCLALIATHDLSLGELEKVYPEKVANYCFEPTIENDQLFFDYQLRPGLATKMNATFLMRKMGIII